jgi:hypothetical protein
VNTNTKKDLKLKALPIRIKLFIFSILGASVFGSISLLIWMASLDTDSKNMSKLAVDAAPLLTWMPYAFIACVTVTYIILYTRTDKEKAMSAKMTRRYFKLSQYKHASEE